MTGRFGVLGRGPRHLIGAWIHHHRQAAADSLRKMLVAPVSTVLTLLVVGIALALPTTLLVLLENAERIAGDLESPSRLSLLLTDDSKADEAQALARGLEARADIVRTVVVLRDEALRRFGEEAGLETLVSSLDHNPLPHTVLVFPESTVTGDRLADLAMGLKKHPGVDEVVFDTRWLSRLEASLEFARRLVLGVGAFMILGAILILGNTIRLSIEARREEIVVIKLIGGGDAYARRPFLYTGLWCGVGGGLLGAGLVAGLFFFLAPPMTLLLELYDSERQFVGLSPVAAIQLALMGGALGLVSAWQAVSVHLRHVEPR